ncbi:MAG: YkgJ family cysteine cluster protein [Blastocatellia bacterium]|nr:YkgJ family cysteine cluster protein [Blastocatellia bacterium]
MDTDLLTLVEHLRQEFESKTQRWISKNQEEGLLDAVFCRRGCVHCCTFAVQTTLLEAFPIAAQVTPEVAALLEKRVERLVELAESALDVDDFDERHRREPGLCVFLNAAGACSIYEIRPFGCRQTISTLPAQFCAPGVPVGLTDSEAETYQAFLDFSPISNGEHHFAASIMDWGSTCSDILLELMQQNWGFSIEGELTVLVFLLLDADFQTAWTHRDISGLKQWVRYKGVGHPFLFTLETGD